MIPYHGCQYRPGKGHYESWFLRANAPDAARAFWIRYTLFVPENSRRPSLGELWAIWFDGDRNQVVAVKDELPLDDCEFAAETMDVRIGQSRLGQRALNGRAELGDNRISWSLSHEGGTEALLFLPENLYQASLPKAKSVVSRPLVTFQGELHVNGERHDISGWRGSENHNWGSKHTDQYAWGQVAGFEGRPDAFLECITARVRIGPVPSPWLTIACLKLGDETLCFNRIGTALKARGRYEFFDWQWRTAAGGDTLEAHINAPREHFAALTYYNPPGGAKTCLNSKIARCELSLQRASGEQILLHSPHGAAFEILTDSNRHGVPMAVPGTIRP